MTVDTTIDIAGRKVGPGHPCYVIAEAGSNHDGDLDQAKRLIDVAAEAGADAVKFQVFRAEAIAAATSDPIASLEGDQFGSFGTDLVDMYRKLELPGEWLPILKDHAEAAGIDFCATPFDEEAVDDLVALGVPFLKVASFEMVHFPLLEHCARTGLPIVLSTGLATMDEVVEAVAVCTRAGASGLVLLHCGIEYPLAFENVNLRAMVAMAERTGLPVGYSDHTLGSSVAVAAAALGACVFEKHFTLDRGLSGPDHQFAMEPHELAEMVRAVREVESALGSAVKAPTPAEDLHLRRGRRSLFAARDIEAGEIIARCDVSVLRPGVGLAPAELERVVGSRVVRAIRRHEPLSWDALERS